ncbi:DUF397 domain-containing protein [Streptomyces venezuelae]|uniref:DUF397 domain-containing protein n=1 Tax=Streptomyces venezuelae TaxID=54571 RepID=UPI003413760D
MPQWQKSSYSNGTDGADCLELTLRRDALLLRESDDPDHILTLTPAALSALISHATHPAAIRK